MLARPYRLRLPMLARPYRLRLPMLARPYRLRLPMLARPYRLRLPMLARPYRLRLPMLAPGPVRWATAVPRALPTPPSRLDRDAATAAWSGHPTQRCARARCLVRWPNP